MRIAMADEGEMGDGMGQGRSDVSMGMWAGVWSGADIRCGARVEDQEVTVSFGGAEFELTLSRVAVEKCIDKFSEALAKLDAGVAGDVRASGA
jgi:hypothetical protein